MPIAIPPVPRTQGLPRGWAIFLLVLWLVVVIWSGLWRLKKRADARRAEDLAWRDSRERNRRDRAAASARTEHVRTSAEPSEARREERGAGANDALSHRGRRVRWRR